MSPLDNIMIVCCFIPCTALGSEGKKKERGTAIIPTIKIICMQLGDRLGGGVGEDRRHSGGLGTSDAV